MSVPVPTLCTTRVSCKPGTCTDPYCRRGRWSRLDGCGRLLDETGLWLLYSWNPGSYHDPVYGRISKLITLCCRILNMTEKIEDNVQGGDIFRMLIPCLRSIAAVYSTGTLTVLSYLL